MLQIEKVVSDRGSRYAVSGGVVTSRAEVDRFLSQLKAKKKYAKAAHNTWAVIFAAPNSVSREQLKDDDGESGAGAIMLKMLEREQLLNHVVVVTRWYGGVHLGADRFRHIKTCVQAYLGCL